METPAERDLPDDVEALKALLLAKQAETEQLHAEIAERKAIKAADDLKIANLTSIITMLQRAQYGTRSEKLRIDPLFGRVIHAADAVAGRAGPRDRVGGEILRIEHGLMARIFADAGIEHPH